LLSLLFLSFHCPSFFELWYAHLVNNHSLAQDFGKILWAYDTTCIYELANTNFKEKKQPFFCGSVYSERLIQSFLFPVHRVCIIIYLYVVRYIFVNMCVLIKKINVLYFVYHCLSCCLYYFCHSIVPPSSNYGMLIWWINIHLFSIFVKSCERIKNTKYYTEN
jgi:hypothetical protein